MYDKERAQASYTETLGFVLTADQPAGKCRWLTVSSPEEPGGVQLVLEPAALPAAGTFQPALRKAGIPFTSSAVDDAQQKADRLTALGVVFTRPPAQGPWGTSAVLDDTCGNLIMLHQVPPAG